MKVLSCHETKRHNMRKANGVWDWKVTISAITTTVPLKPRKSRTAELHFSHPETVP
jgi:hypothetical protein